MTDWMRTHDNYFDRAGREIDESLWLALQGAPQRTVVARTKITSTDDPTIRHEVSTVWLGSNHNYGYGDPLTFETMVFGDDDEEYSQRYATEEAAKVGHAETVTVVAATVPDALIRDYDA
ncbi:hypothetical protein ACWCQM_11505 [Streptomyces sp. NPDC002125]